jgi:hypothetical protein
MEERSLNYLGEIMKTEGLNEYIFGKMVGDEAIKARQRRQKSMKSSGIAEEEIIHTPLTIADMRAGLETLNYYRTASLQLLQESHVALSKKASKF